MRGKPFGPMLPSPMFRLKSWSLWAAPGRLFAIFCSLKKGPYFFSTNVSRIWSNSTLGTVLSAWAFSRLRKAENSKASFASGLSM